MYIPFATCILLVSVMGENFKLPVLNTQILSARENFYKQEDILSLLITQQQGEIRGQGDISAASHFWSINLFKN